MATMTKPDYGTANLHLWRLLPDFGEMQDSADYRVTCDECAALIAEDEYDANDGLCDTCNAKVHFTCDECGEEFHEDERSEYDPKLCEECGSAKRTKVADDLWEEITDLAGSWSGEEWEIPNLKKLLAYARRLKREA
jgi:hypothetical protein